MEASVPRRSPTGRCVELVAERPGEGRHSARIGHRLDVDLLHPRGNAAVAAALHRDVRTGLDRVESLQVHRRQPTHHAVELALDSNPARTRRVMECDTAVRALGGSQRRAHDPAECRPFERHRQVDLGENGGRVGADVAHVKAPRPTAALSVPRPPSRSSIRRQTSLTGVSGPVRLATRPQGLSTEKANGSAATQDVHPPWSSWRFGGHRLDRLVSGGCRPGSDRDRARRGCHDHKVLRLLLRQDECPVGPAGQQGA